VIVLAGRDARFWNDTIVRNPRRARIQQLAALRIIVIDRHIHRLFVDRRRDLAAPKGPDFATSNVDVARSIAESPRGP
jgi:hypothetical protein